MPEVTWTAEQVDDLEAWFLDAKNTDMVAISRRFGAIPPSSRFNIWKRLSDEIRKRKKAQRLTAEQSEDVRAISGEGLFSPDFRKVQWYWDLARKDECLRESIGPFRT